mmetsp:Transcript_71668/g.171150  ORF Transcript_71668/g.171150 Transcript_71668/m.171150 type:complete len:642 (+) Transcript_71668:63-1988(+)
MAEMAAGSGAEAVRILKTLTADEASGEDWSPYFKKQRLDEVLTGLVAGLQAAEPADPITWMIQHLVACKEKAKEELVEKKPVKKCTKGKRARVNISAVLRRGCRAILNVVCQDGPFEAIEDASSPSALIYFVWSGQGLLQRLNHPSAAEKVPRLPSHAWVNRLPGIGCICDKVNMALSLRLLQKMWPEKFRFWPKSWLLPAEADQLCTYLDKHKSETVIVKPEGGSQGDGIFLVQNAADLRLKLSAKPHFGAGFGALAQRYLPAPLLLDGLKFDLRLYVVVTSLDPLEAYLCEEGLARFCTAKYEEPTAANANEVYMHLTNYSVNKKSAAFKDEDPFNVHTRASKRPLSTLLLQIAAQEQERGRSGDIAEKLMRSCEETCAVLLQAMVPVMKVTYDRVAKEAAPKGKVSPMKRKSEEEEEESEEAEEFAPNCFQILGVDVLLDANLQPWLLEVNARPSMDISNPVRLSEAPPGTRRCVCRDMDGEDHYHVNSEVDIRVKKQVVEGAFQLALGKGQLEGLPGFRTMDFERFSPSEAQETLQAVARIYQEAGGQKKAFTTSGLRRTLANAVSEKFPAHQLDTLVTKWKHQGYRQDTAAEEDQGDIAVLDFAALLQEIAVARSGREEDPLDALVSLIQLCDPEG